MDPLGERDPAVQELVAANNAFGIDLYRRQRASRDNLVLSPYNIALALAIAYIGSSGETRSQMAAVLGIGGLEEALHPAFATLARNLALVHENSPIDLSNAVGLWLGQGYDLRPEFVRLAQTGYCASVHLADFAQEPETVRSAINDWVAGRTNGHIQGLLTPGTVDTLTRLVLATAIYFHGDWRHPFDPDRTSLDSFWIGPETWVKIPFMAQEFETGYAESQEWQLLRLPYAGGTVSMIIVLPRRRDGLVALEDSLSCQVLAEWISLIRRREVRIRLPRFKISAGFSLTTALTSLGMRDAFSPADADFSRLAAPDKPLYISAVVHKAFVEVNEQGTEAAAATGVAFAVKSMPPPPVDFRADHPFLLLIRHDPSGSILFLGRAANPATQD